MKIFFHFLRQELLLVRGLFVVLLLMQIVRLIALLGWMGPVSGAGPMLAVILAGLGLFGLAAVMVRSVFGFNSPVDNETFVATRPVRCWELGLAKIATFLLVLLGAILPVEMIYLVAEGLSGEDVLWGVLQVGIFLTVCSLLVAGVFWLFRTKKEHLIGWSALVVVTSGALFLGGIIEYFLGEDRVMFSSRFLFEDRFSMVRIFGALALGMFGVWVLLGFYWRRGTRGFGTRLGAGVVWVLVLVLGLWFLPHRGLEQEQRVEAAPMVVEVFEQRDRGGRVSYRVEAEPLPKRLLDGSDEFLTVTSLSVDGGERIELPVFSPAQNLGSKAFRNWGDFFERRVFGEWFEEEPICMLDYRPMNQERRATIQLSKELIGSRELEMKIELSQHHMQWKQVAKLPFENGARSGRWSLVDCGQADTGGGRPWMVRLSEKRYRNWLRGDSRAPSERSLRVAVYDEKRNICLFGRPVISVLSVGGLSALPWREIKVKLPLECEHLFREVDLSHCCLMVFEPSARQGGRLSWEGRVKVKEWQGSNQGLANDKRVFSLSDFEAWLLKNPVPGETASEREVARYLVALLGFSNQLKRGFSEEHEVIGELAALARNHLLLFERALGELALDQPYSRWLLEAAVAKGITEKDFVSDLEQMIRNKRVRRVAREKGWFKPLAEVLVQGARNGDERMLEEAIRLPGKAGLSNEDCLMFFSRNPNVALYRILSEDPELRVLLDEEIDRALHESVRWVIPFHCEIDGKLRLALASGHPDAPAIFQEVLRSEFSQGDEGFVFRGVFLQYFVAEYGNGEPTNWLLEFLKTKPENWVFDEKEKRFRVRVVKSEEESG